MTKFKSVKAVIFDLDGTILDTETIYQSVFEDICKRYNKVLPLETRLKLLGTTEENSCRITVNDCELPCSVEEFLEQFKVLTSERLGSCEILPGAERLIKHLHENGVPIALATGSWATSVEIKTKNHEALFSLFHHKVTGSDSEVKQGKPAPDIFLIAAQRFNEPIDPKECLVFEDATNGIKAAQAAGMQCVMIPQHSAEGLSKEPDLVLRSLDEFKPEEFGLPPYQS